MSDGVMIAAIICVTLFAINVLNRHDKKESKKGGQDNGND